MTGAEALRLLFPDPTLSPRLEQLRIVAGSRIKGMLAGKRRSSTLGGSQEFADYRPYSPGDDIRRIDWNVYGRTGRAYMRQYWDEQELAVHVYVDVTRSMHFGGERADKLTFAMRMAAVIGYAALCGDDRVEIKLFEERICEALPQVQGRSSIPRMLQFLAKALLEQQRMVNELDDSQKATIQGTSDMSMPFLNPVATPRRSGSSWIITDAMYESGIEQVLLSQRAAGQQPVLLHLLSPEEIHPQLAGELRLIDNELLTSKDVAIGHAVLREYEAELKQFQHSLRTLCARYNAHYVFLSTDMQPEQALIELLSQGVLNKNGVR